MDRLGRTTAANRGTPKNMQGNFTTTLKAILINFCEWLRCLGLSL